jgi:hypothetical protein
MPGVTIERSMTLALVAWLAPVVLASAQPATATVEVRLHVADDATAVNSERSVRVELRSILDQSLSRSAFLHPQEPARFRFVPPGRYRISADRVHRKLDLDLVPGDTVTIQVLTAVADGDARSADLHIGERSRTGYGTRWSSAPLHLLPGSGGVFGIIERSDPLIVTERIEGGGAYPEMQRLAASGASWTQTSYWLDGANITDPDRTGFPLMYPNVDALDSMSVVTAGHSPDGYGAGTSVTLVPRRPASSWERRVDVMGSPAGFQAVNVLPNAPAVGRLNSFGSGSFLLSGPVTRRLGVLAAGALTRSSRLERDRPDILASRTHSLSTHVVFGATAQDELRVFGQYDRTSFPSSGRARLVDPGLQQDDRFTVLSSTWDHRPALGLAWSANITHTRATFEPPLSGRQITATMERLRDGPVYELASAATSRRNRTYVSWRADPGPVRWLRMRHLPQLGVNASWSHVGRNAPGNTQVGELLYGVPARVWQYSSTGAPSEWSSTELALWAASQIALTRRFDLDIGLRAAATFASRDGSDADVRWRALSPSVRATWRVLGNERLTLMVGHGRYSSRLPLNYLSFGDPNSLSGTVHRWEDRNADRRLHPDEIGALIARVGPCCAGSRPNAISADLRAPNTVEYLVGLRTRVSRHITLHLGGTDRRQFGLIQPVNAAYVPENFDVTLVHDPALDMGRTEDDQLLPIFSRRPSSFGTDWYVLQNVDHNSSRDHGLDLVLERPFDGKWSTLIGATAHRSEGIGGNRGSRPDENDQGVLGEVFSNPNAQTYSRGRLFFERGYVIKWAGLWQFPIGLRGAAAARYQDGQHFTRVVLADVAQGPDAVPTLPRGRTRFTYTFTLDARIEQQITIARRRAAVVLEAYNLLNTNNEVEEDETTGESFRVSTAVQPPLSVRVGLRFFF